MTETAGPTLAFIEAACVPRDAWHATGTLERAELLLASHPGVASRDINAAGSRYLKLDHTRSEGFVRAATALLDAGASPNTGWDGATR